MRTATEIQERYLTCLVLFAFIYSVKAILGAASFVFVDAAETLRALGSLFGWLAGGVLLIGAFSQLFRQTRLLWSIRGLADLRRRGRIRGDGFTFNAIKMASWFSVVLTAATLGFFADVVKTSARPPVFYLDITLFICLATFSIAFFAFDLIAAGGSAGDASG
jgi:hypothetical protein